MTTCYPIFPWGSQDEHQRLHPSSEQGNEALDQPSSCREVVCVAARLDTMSHQPEHSGLAVGELRAFGLPTHLTITLSTLFFMWSVVEWETNRSSRNMKDELYQETVTKACDPFRGSPEACADNQWRVHLMRSKGHVMNANWRKWCENVFKKLLFPSR